jgi:hypothetical protein
MAAIADAALAVDSRVGRVTVEDVSLRERVDLGIAAGLGDGPRRIARHRRVLQRGVGW